MRKNQNSGELYLVIFIAYLGLRIHFFQFFFVVLLKQLISSLAYANWKEVGSEYDLSRFLSWDFKDPRILGFGDSARYANFHNFCPFCQM